MSFAEIQKLKELLKTLQGSGEATTRIRMEVGRAIEKIQKERSAARMMASADISQPIGLLESSYEKSSLMGERWKPPWDPTWNPLPTGMERTEPEILNPRAFDVNLNIYSPLGVQRRLTDREINKIVTSDLPQRTKEIVIKKLEYRGNILDNAERDIGGLATTTGAARTLTSKRDNIDSNIQKIIRLKRSGTSIWSQKELDDLLRARLVERDRIDKSISTMKTGLPLDPITSKKLESIDDSIYKMGATQWDEKRGIPLNWMNTNKAYETPTAIEQLSGLFFTSDRIPGTLGTDLLSFKDPKKVLNKATIFTQKQWRDKEAAQQEIQFINNYLLDPQMAAEYAKTAPFSFFKYWSEKGGTLGLKEHMQSLKIAARADDVEVETAKWGALTTVKDVKTKEFTFASLRGQVTELWDPTSPRISQVGLLKDSSGESIKFTIWRNQQQNVPKVEVGKNYYFGNVASQEWQSRWNLNVNQFSAIEEIKPMPFNTAPSHIIPGSKVELRDFSKPYSIDTKKGTITYTTKSGKIVEMPIPQAGTTKLKNFRLGDEPGDLAAFLPFAGLPFLMGNVTGGTAQIDSQQSMRMNTHPMIQESFTETYNNLRELGSIWWQKGSEVYPRYKERDADYRKEMAEGTMSPYRKYLPLDFGLTILDVLGAGLYPLVYPQQALSGGAMGKKWMEGIREEVSPSKALGIEDTWTGLGSDILLDPLNLSLGAGLVGKLSKAESVWDAVKMMGAGVPKLLKNDEAVLGRKTATGHKINKNTVGKMTALRLNQKEMSTRQQVFLETQIRAESWNRGKPGEFFEKLYKESYEQIKSDYIAAEGITPEQFENIARNDPTFADKMTTWLYSEYGRKTGKVPAAATIPKPKPAAVAAESVPIQELQTSAKSSQTLSPKKLLENENGGYLDPKEDFGKLIDTYGNFAVVVKDVNGHRAILNAADYQLLQKNPFFAERVRAVWVKPDTTAVVKPEILSGFMQDIHPDKFKVDGREYTSLTDGSLEEAIQKIGEINFKLEASVTPAQKKKFEDMLLDKNIQSLLKEYEIDEVIIEAPNKHTLSGQGSINTKTRSIKFNADADSPIDTILHELGHQTFQDLTKNEQNKLIDRIKEANVPRSKGYLQLEEYEEAVAETLYKEPTVFPEYANKVKGTKISEFSQYELRDYNPELQEFPLEKYLETLRKNTQSGTGTPVSASMPVNPAISIPVASAPVPETAVASSVMHDYVSEFTKTSKGPDYIKEEILRRYTMAEKLGVTQEIEDLSAQRLTAKQVAQKIVASGKVKANAGGSDSAFSIAVDMVRGVRSVRNIPSTDDKVEFAEWLTAWTQKKQPLHAQDSAQMPEIGLLKSQQTPTSPIITSNALNPPAAPSVMLPIDHATEPMVQEIVARRESRGEVTTSEQLNHIRKSVLNGVKETAEYQKRTAEGKKFSWGTLALGAGAGIAATSSLYSLPEEEQEANKEQVRQALMPSEEQGILASAVDILNMDSYIEGAAILNAHALLIGDSKRYDWKDRITPSMALGIQNKETSLFSLRGAAGTFLDISVAPTTYLSLGSGAAVKIGSVGGKGAKALKLSKTGVKEISTFTKKYGEEMGTLEFAHHIEQNPAFQKKVLAAGGMSLRGWGQEVNLIPGSVFDPVANAAKESAMQFSLEHPAAFKKVAGMQEYLENKFVVRAAVKRLPRSSRLLPMEADYAEKAMLLPKKVRFDIAQGTERDIELAKEARKSFGENYEEIVYNLIEEPVTRESAKLTREQQAIIEELETFNKGFAAQEKELGLLDTEMSGYLRHTLTPDAKKYLEKGGRKVSTELYTPLSVENKFGTKRTIKGTVAQINEQARKELGIDFDYFEANPFKATSIRRAESVKAVEQAKLLKWTVEKYGVPKEVALAQPDKYVQSSVAYIKGEWLPKPIAEDIEKEFVQKDTDTALKLYDKALNAWKYGATVTHPAYHASNVVGGIFNNWLAEVDPISYYRSSRLLLGGDKDKVFTTALGEKYSGQELLKMAGESGILSQPGMMDIQKLSYEIADTHKEKAIELTKKTANSPITLAQYEENFIRLSLFNDRIMKGDTIQGARAWVSEFQFQYSKESFTPFERDYMKRMVPFYAWMRGNIPLQTKQMLYNPGKYAQFGKLTNAAVGGQELPQYAEGDLTWMYPWNESTGTFNYMRTPATDLDIFNDPLWYGVGAITPFAKYPIEEVLGFNTYTGKDFDRDMPWYNPQQSAASNLIVGRTGRDAGALSDVYEDRNSGKQAAKYLVGIGQASTKTRKKSDIELRDAYRKYTGRPNDFTYEQRLQLMQRDNWASAQSGISGEFEQLQGGHFYPAELGGAALPWNYITQTREENYEWRSAQNYIENLPERELQREEAWGRYEAEYAAGVDEINTRTMDNRGHPENEALKEKKRYDLRKSANIKIYNRQLNTVRSAIRSAEKDLRGEKKKVEDVRAKGYRDPASEAQIKVIEAVLTEYRVLYEKVSGLRDAEQGKEFELPVQGTDLSRFQPMDIGGYDKYAVRYGRGSELAKPEDIEKLVDLKKITAYYAATKSYGPVAGFRPGTPEDVKNRILITRDPHYQELAQIANPLISGAGWEGISGKNYIGPRNISEIRAVVEGSVSESEPVIGMGEPPAWYSDQQVSQESGQTTGFDYNDPEFREVVREIVQETLSEGIVSD